MPKKNVLPDEYRNTLDDFDQRRPLAWATDKDLKAQVETKTTHIEELGERIEELRRQIETLEEIRTQEYRDISAAEDERKYRKARAQFENMDADDRLVFWGYARGGDLVGRKYLVWRNWGFNVRDRYLNLAIYLNAALRPKREG